MQKVLANEPIHYVLKKLTSLPMCGFIARLVEHRTGIAEVTGSNPVEAVIFFRLLLSNCLNWKIYCDDHSSPSSTATVQIWIISYIYFTSVSKFFNSFAFDGDDISRLTFAERDWLKNCQDNVNAALKLLQRNVHVCKLRFRVLVGDWSKLSVAGAAINCCCIQMLLLFQR